MQVSTRSKYNFNFLYALIGVVIVCTYFLPVFLADAYTIPSTFPDAWAFIWDIWRFGNLSIDSQESIYYTSKIFHPFGTSLALDTQAEGLLLPLSKLKSFLNPFQIFGIAAVICFVLNFVAFFWVLSAVSSRERISLFIAILLSFHPFFIGHLAAGHINLLCFFPLCIASGSIVLAIKERELSTTRLLLLTLSTAFSFYSSLYYSYFLFITLGALILPLMLRGEIYLAIKLALSSLVGVFLALPKLLLVISAYRSGEFFPDHLPEAHSANLAHFICPGENQILGTFLNCVVDGLGRAENGLYIGFALVLFTVILLVSAQPHKLEKSKQHSILALALFFLILSLGPSIKFFSTELLQNYFFIIFDKLPFFPSVPARFGYVAIFFYLIWISQYLVSLKLTKTMSTGLIVIALVACVEFFPATTPMSSIELRKTDFSELRSNPKILAIHDFTRSHHRRLLNQIFHQKSITSAHVSRASKNIIGFYRRNKFLLSARKGQVITEDMAKKAWKELNLDGVLTESGQSEYHRNLSVHEWLIANSSQRFRLYSVN